MKTINNNEYVEIEDSTKLKYLFDKYQKNIDINLSASEILNTYKNQSQEEKDSKTNSQYIIDNSKNLENFSIKIKKEKRTNNKKFFGIITSIVSTLAVSFTLLGIFVFPNLGSSTNPPITSNPIYNNDFIIKNSSVKSVISEELITLSVYDFDNSQHTIKNNVKLQNRDNDIDYQTFKQVTDTYEKLQNGIATSFYLDNFETKVSVVNEIYNNTNFVYSLEIFSKENNEVLAKYLYNEQNNTSNNGKTILAASGYYFVNGETYEASFTNKTETSKDESETKIKGTFINRELNKYSIAEKEDEFESQEVENSYTFKEYSSLEDLNRDKYLYKITYSREKENNEEEIELNFEELIDNKYVEFDFEKIKFITQNRVSFEYSYEFNNTEYEGNIYLDYLETNRVYTDKNNPSLKISYKI